MPRRAEIQPRPLTADPIYDSQLVTQLINRVMLHGKKSNAEAIVYGALDKVGAKTGRPPAEVLEQISERHDEREPERIADLRGGHQQSGGRGRHREGAGDRVQQRLRVVEVRRRCAAREREQQHQSLADRRLRVGGLSRLGRGHRR